MYAHVLVDLLIPVLGFQVIVSLSDEPPISRASFTMQGRGDVNHRETSVENLFYYPSTALHESDNVSADQSETVRTARTARGSIPD